MTRAQQAADNLRNGNLSDARNHARRASVLDLIAALMEHGDSEHKAILGSRWLKYGGQANWDCYCRAD